MSTRVIGTAGKYSASMGRSNAARALGQTVVSWLSFIGAGFLTLIALSQGRTAMVVLAVAACGLVAAGFRARQRAQKASVQAGRQQRGTSSEQEVVAALRKARVDLVINGAELNAGGDADHVVAHLRGRGRGVLAVIETKSGGGLVRMNGRAILSGKAGRAIPGDPIRQVCRQRDALARRTSRAVRAIVCVPGMTNDVFTVDGVIVCGTKHIAGLFAHDLPDDHLTADDVRLLGENIVPKD